MYEKKIEDGFEVLEIPKGSWTEAIFAKVKPLAEKPRYKSETDYELEKSRHNFDDEEEDEEEEDVVINNNGYDDDEDDDDTFDEDKLTEESYRTTFDTNPEDLNLEAVDVADDEY